MLLLELEASLAEDGWIHNRWTVEEIYHLMLPQDAGEVHTQRAQSRYSCIEALDRNQPQASSVKTTHSIWQ